MTTMDVSRRRRHLLKEMGCNVHRSHTWSQKPEADPLTLSSLLKSAQTTSCSFKTCFIIFLNPLGPQPSSLFFFSDFEPLDICGACSEGSQVNPSLFSPWCSSHLFMLSILSTAFHCGHRGGADFKYSYL